MGRLLPLFLGVFSTLHILGVSAQAAPACVETCTNEVRNKYTDLKCSDASAAACFCTNPTFSAAILECSKAQCGGTADNVFTYLSEHFCAGHPLPKPDSTAAPSSAASQTPTPSAPATTSTPAAAETTPATSSSTTATPAATTSLSAESTTTSTTAETTGASTTSSSPSSTSDSAASTTSSGAASTTSSGAATEASSSKGLSQAAIAGIGVGIGAAVIAIAGIVICMLLKARRRKPSRNGNNRDISKPLPGPHRTYGQRDTNFRRDRNHSTEKFGNDLEMTSHRYEDMVPRTQPRTMV